MKAWVPVLLIAMIVMVVTLTACDETEVKTEQNVAGDAAIEQVFDEEFPDEGTTYGDDLDTLDSDLSFS